MTNKKKANGNEPTSPAIKGLEEKKAKIEAKINQLKEKERKLDARRKILAGGWLLALARTEESIQELLKSRFYPTLKDDKDRALFGFPPLSESEKNLDQPTPPPIAPSVADSGQPTPGKILVRFPGGHPGPEILAAMKATGKGWRWDSENSLWTGEADPEAVRNAVDSVAVEIREA